MSAALSAVCRKHATESVRVFCACPFFNLLLNYGNLVILAERSISNRMRLYRKKRRSYVALLLAADNARR